MNDTKPTDPADTPAETNEPSAPEQTAPAETKSALDGAKEKARKAAEGVKNLKESLKTHDFKAELRDAFAETKKNPASLWKKPETLRPGKDLAVVGLAASVVLLLLLLVTSSSFLGLVCFVLGLGALLFSALGLKTEGRKFAVGGSVAGLLVVLCALGQIFEPGTNPEDDGSIKIAVSSGDYPILVANEGKRTGKAENIIKAAENASKFKSLNFFGFYTGMSAADFKTLRDHYGLNGEQLFFEYNWENGEVFKMCFTPKALNVITSWPNNFDTVEIQMLQYFGIVEWNNIKEVIEGEVDSIFQSDEERLFFGDKANVPRKYRTADGVVAKLFPKGWDQSRFEVFDILDTERQKVAKTVMRHFLFTNKMRKAGNELLAKGIKTKMLMLPDNIELLMKEDSEHGLWVSEFPLLKWQLEAVLSGAESILVSNEPASDETPVLMVKRNDDPNDRRPAWTKYKSNFFMVDRTDNSSRGSVSRGPVSFKEFTGKLNGLSAVVESRLAFWQEPEFGQGERVVKGGRIDDTVFLIAAPKEAIDAWMEASQPEEAKRHYSFTCKMMSAEKKLKAAGIKTKMIILPGDVELLMKEDPANNRWISAFPLLRWQRNVVMPDMTFDDRRYSKTDDSPVLMELFTLEFPGNINIGLKDFVKILNERPEIVESGLIFKDESERENEDRNLSPGILVAQPR